MLQERIVLNLRSYKVSYDLNDVSDEIFYT